jgi:archaellum component FlaC
VEQFATLASRLGIELPTNVLQSLTSQASKNDPVLPQQQESHYRYDPVDDDDSPQAQQAAFFKSETEEGSTSPFDDVAPTIEELRRTAEEAIAAVTNKKRSYDDTAGEAKGVGDTNKPLYSKRRKKPRLSDCETRLAELKAENEHLKRHLQNVSNKAYRFDQEKEEAGKRIRRLHDANAGPEEMAKAVQEFSDMYSDYGINRQQELSFHLEQLQRYVSFW